MRTRAEVRAAIEALDVSSENFEVELRALENELRALELSERARADEGPPADTNPNANESIEARESLATGNAVPAIVQGGIERSAVEQDLEYRKAFMNYVCRGTAIPAEYRASATTMTTDIGAVIPTTIMNEVIKKVKVYGQIYSRVRKLNVAGGVEFPIGDIIPTATWITEDKVSDTIKTDMTAKVSFSYHILELRLGQSLLSTVVSLALFEQQITELLVEGMVKAIDIAVIKGTGVNQPTGVLVDTRVPAAQKIAIKAADLSYKGWKSVFAKQPLADRNSGVIITTNANFELHMDGLTDSAGQPVARTNYGLDGVGVLRFMGREVLLVENDVLADYDGATAGSAFAIIMSLSDFAMNSNMQLGYKRYFNDDTNKWVSKGLLIADGKLLKTDNVLILNKSTTA